ncbi:MAG: protocatechuate 3,4-dioxygenase subunit alpha [Hyphomicrobiaceae bacterium]
MTLKQTPSQTAGPFFHYMLTPEQSGYPFTGLATPAMADETTPGARVALAGRITDGQGNPIPDCLVELWQADAMGRYAHPADKRSSNAAFKGFGRCATDEDGRFVFQTIKPGAIGDGQAPHATLILFTRGGQNHLYTRMYFADEGEANAEDPVLASVPADRRETLIARKTETGYALDIRVQGDGETVFFDV